MSKQISEYLDACHDYKDLLLNPLTSLHPDHVQAYALKKYHLQQKIDAFECEIYLQWVLTVTDK